jgi:hypothetical protein
MMSLIPCTAWRSTSSATRNASETGVLRATVCSRRSLGIAITESTQSFSWARPSMACCMRRLPSRLNGSVTTAIDSTLPLSPPNWLAIDATTGAAPVPVPPPRPVVMNTMSAPSSASQIFSVSSTAAWRPTSGLEPAPRPLVSLVPIWILMPARLLRSACRSELIAMNSTPWTPDAIMRDSALPPPPPTPTTLMRAPFVSSSAKAIRCPSFDWLMKGSLLYPLGTTRQEAALQANALAVARDHGTPAHLAARISGFPQLARRAPGRLAQHGRHERLLGKRRPLLFRPH